MKKKHQTSSIALIHVPDELRDFIVHPTLVLTRRSGEAILKQMKSGKSTKALRDLMRSED